MLSLWYQEHIKKVLLQRKAVSSNGSFINKYLQILYLNISRSQIRLRCKWEYFILKNIFQQLCSIRITLLQFFSFLEKFQEQLNNKYFQLLCMHSNFCSFSNKTHWPNIKEIILPCVLQGQKLFVQKMHTQNIIKTF